MTETKKNLRVALLGCGQIADAHLQEISKLSDVSVVGVCDLHQDLADQAAARYGVPAAYTDLNQMLELARPQVVHVTTPAHTHGALTIKLLEAGVHVYVEKPFTVDFAEAERVMAAAEQAGRLVCLGHDQLFDPVWLRLRALVANGEIGPVSHIESVLGYPLSGSFGRQITSDPHHWVRHLPGGLFQNTMQHPLYRITNFMADENPAFEAHWHRTEGRNFPTEMTVMFRGRDVSAHLLFATNIQSQRITRVYGRNGALEFDPDAQTIRRIRQSELPGAFGKIEMPLRQLRESAANVARNLWRFARSDIHYFAGMNTLFDRFYDAIRQGGEPPVSYAEAMRVTRLMDQIFTECHRQDQAVQSDPLPRIQAVSA